VELEPGTTKMELVVNCPDPAATTPIAATIVEDRSGLLSHLDPLPTMQGAGLPEVDTTPLATGGIMTQYHDITNSHATEKVTVTVMASVRPLTAGSHTCSLAIGSATVNLAFTAVAPPVVATSVRIT
jgi:hypothetical protein